MYKVNILIKFIALLLTIAIVLLTNNRIILWLLLVLLTFYNVFKNKSKKLLLIDLILIVLLGLSTNIEICLILFKFLFIFNLLITFYKSLTYDDKKSIFKKDTSTRTNYYEKNFDRIVKNIEDKRKNIYDNDVSIDDRIESDLERSYLQSKIRYYGLYKKDRWYNWNRIDTLILLFVLVVFVTLFILR